MALSCNFDGGTLRIINGMPGCARLLLVAATVPQLNCLPGREFWGRHNFFITTAKLIVHKHQYYRKTILLLLTITTSPPVDNCPLLSVQESQQLGEQMFRPPDLDILDETSQSKSSPTKFLFVTSTTGLPS